MLFDNSALHFIQYNAILLACLAHMMLMYNVTFTWLLGTIFFVIHSLDLALVVFAL